MSHSPRGAQLSLILALLVGGIAAADEPEAVASGTSVDCQVIYETVDGVYVGIGSGAGLEEGQTGSLHYQGRPVGRIRVTNVASTSTYLRVLSEKGPGFPGVGDNVTIVLDQRVEEEAPEAPKEVSPTLRDRNQEDTPFEPLLTPPNTSEAGVTESRNIFHGRLTVRQLYQNASDDFLEFDRLQVRSSGSWQRIDGTPWTLEWSGDFAYRDGDALIYAPNYRQVRPEIYNLAFFRRFDGESFVRMGRFLPTALPAVGFLDGGQYEWVVSESLRLGVMGGLKPDRLELHPSWEEPTLVPYVTFGNGALLDDHVSSTLGFYGSLFDGDVDRAAVLLDQTLRRGRWHFFNSAEVDFNTVDDDVDLTRINFSANYRMTSWLRFRGGVDRFQIPNTEAERDSLPEITLPADAFIDQDYWRARLSSTQQFGRWTLEQEGAYYESDVDDGVRWRASFTRRDWFGNAGASATLDLYNTVGVEFDGYGGRLTGYVPFRGNRFWLEPSVAFRMAETDLDDVEMEVLDGSLWAQWLIGDAWSLRTGFSYAEADDDYDRYLFDLGITYRW